MKSRVNRHGRGELARLTVEGRELRQGPTASNVRKGRGMLALGTKMQRRCFGRGCENLRHVMAFQWRGPVPETGKWSSVMKDTLHCGH
jgi:hypothetical protein